MYAVDGIPLDNAVADAVAIVRTIRTDPDAVIDVLAAMTHQELQMVVATLAQLYADTLEQPGIARST